MRLLRLTRRCVHTSTDDTRRLLRELLRETAQSVAVVTALLPGSDPAQHPPTLANTPPYHGATLSSFSSIALDPLPLVAFSLRVPSRMASALNAHVASPFPSPPSAHLTINILSAAQPHLAHRFARPDLHPRPFADPEVRWTPSADGLPVLDGALGALSCRLVGRSVPLAHLGRGGPASGASWSSQSMCSGSESGALDALADAFGAGSVHGPCGRACELNVSASAEGEGDVPQASAGLGLASELFIARVLRVERVPVTEVDERDAGLYKLPLLYHRRRYATVADCVKS